MPLKTEITIDGKNGGAITAINGVKSSLTDLGKVSGGMQNIFNQILPAATLAGITTGVAHLMKQSIDTADNMFKLSQKVGVTVSSLSTLKYAAELSDVSLEELTNGLGKLSKNLYDVSLGSGESIDKLFKKLGISVIDTSGQLRQTDKVLIDLADKFKLMQDGTEKTAIAMTLFGRSGKDLIPFLNEGSQGIEKLTDEARKLGIEISDDFALRAQNFNDSISKMKNLVSGIGMDITSALLPTLEALANLFASLPRDVVRVSAEMAALGLTVYSIDRALKAVNISLFATKSALVKTGIGAIAVIAGTLAAELLLARDSSDQLNVSYDSQLIRLKELIPENQKLTKEIKEQTLARISDAIMQRETELYDLMKKRISAAKELEGSKPFNPSDPGAYADNVNRISQNIKQADPDVQALQNHIAKLGALFQQVNDAKLKPFTDGLSKLGKEWQETKKKLEIEIKLSGLSPLHREMIQLMISVDEMKEKFKTIPESGTVVEQYYDRIIQQLIAINNLKGAPIPDMKIPEPVALPDEVVKRYQDRYAQLKEMGIEFTTWEMTQYSWQLLETQNFYDNLQEASYNFYQASGNQSKAFFGIYKAMAMARAAISTYESAVNSYNALSSIPIVGPALGFAAAAAAVTFGLSNIARISAMSPGGGGGGGVSVPSGSVSNINNNTSNNDNRSNNYTINIYGDASTTQDKDRFAREIIDALEKAKNDRMGGGG